MATTQTVDRRTFLRASAIAGGGLMVGGYLQSLVDPDWTTAAAAGLFEPNIWVRIAPDDTVTIMLSAGSCDTACHGNPVWFDDVTFEKLP